MSWYTPVTDFLSKDIGSGLYNFGADALGSKGANVGEFLQGKSVSPTEMQEALAANKAFRERTQGELDNYRGYVPGQVVVGTQDQGRMDVAGARMSRAQFNAANMRENAGDVARQQRALGLAEDAAMGRAPSVAEIQGQQQLQQALQSQLAMAARARGGNMSLALRSAGQSAAQMQGQAAQSAAMLRAQEMATARDQFARGSQGARDTSAQFDLARQGLTQQGARDMAATASDRTKMGLTAQTTNQQFGLSAAQLAAEEKARLRGLISDTYGRESQGASDLFQAYSSNRRGWAQPIAGGVAAYASGGSSVAATNSGGGSGGGFSNTPKPNPF